MRPTHDTIYTEIWKKKHTGVRVFKFSVTSSNISFRTSIISILKFHLNASYMGEKQDNTKSKYINIKFVGNG